MNSEIEKSSQKHLNNCILDKDTGMVGRGHNKEEEKLANGMMPLRLNRIFTNSRKTRSKHRSDSAHIM